MISLPHRDVQDALRAAFARAESGDDPQSIVKLVHDKVPEVFVRDWLLAAPQLGLNAA